MKLVSKIFGILRKRMVTKYVFKDPFVLDALNFTVITGIIIFLFAVFGPKLSPGFMILLIFVWLLVIFVWWNVLLLKGFKIFIGNFILRIKIVVAKLLDFWSKRGYYRFRFTTLYISWKNKFIFRFYNFFDPLPAWGKKEETAHWLERIPAKYAQRYTRYMFVESVITASYWEMVDVKQAHKKDRKLLSKIKKATEKIRNYQEDLYRSASRRAFEERHYK